jgi:DNA-binding MarR family transcriptional regulator
MTSAHRLTIPQEDYVLELLRAARLLEGEGERFFQKYNLTIAQFNVLNVLAYNPGMPQAELKKVLVVGKATVSSVVAGLLTRRLITQKLDALDRRAKKLSLSAAGKTLWSQASPDYVKSLKERFPTIRASELKQLQAALAPLSDLVPTA